MGTSDPDNDPTTNMRNLGMVGTADPDDDPDANAKIHISILGRLFIELQLNIGYRIDKHMHIF